MNNSGRFLGVFLAVLFTIFCARFMFLDQLLRYINKNNAIVAAGYKHLTFPLPHYSSLFRDSKKNILVGSSVFQGYISDKSYFGDNFSKNFEVYTKLNHGYYQFINELPLIHQRTGRHLIFFVQPGEFSFPFDLGNKFFLAQPISNEELKMHADLLMKFYERHPQSMKLLRIFIGQLLPMYLLHQSSADSFIFSVIKEVVIDFQYDSPSNLKKLKSESQIPTRHSVQSKMEGSYIVAMSEEVIDFNRIYLLHIIKSLLKNFQVTFIELYPLSSCENDSSRQTRSDFLEAMKDLTKHYKDAGLAFISRDELPAPPNALFVDCMHIDSKNVSLEKLSFLRAYFNAVFKKTGVVNFQLQN